MRRLVLSPILVSTTALFHIACGSTPEWSCAEVSVPGGSTTECVSTTGSALTLESDSVVRSYECDATIVGDCPPEGASSPKPRRSGGCASRSGSSGGAGGAPGTETPGSYVSSDPLLECAYGSKSFVLQFGLIVRRLRVDWLHGWRGFRRSGPTKRPRKQRRCQAVAMVAARAQQAKATAAEVARPCLPAKTKRQMQEVIKKAIRPAVGAQAVARRAEAPRAAGRQVGGSSGSGGGKVFQCSEYEAGKRCCRAKRGEMRQRSQPSTCGACVEAKAESAGECSAPSTGGCWVTGGGFISDKGGRDNFGGNAKSMKDRHIQGEWNHVDHESGEHIHGRPSYLFCRQIDEPGPGRSGWQKRFQDESSVSRRRRETSIERRLDRWLLVRCNGEGSRRGQKRRRCL